MRHADRRPAPSAATARCAGWPAAGRSRAAGTGRGGSRPRLRSSGPRSGLGASGTAPTLAARAGSCRPATTRMGAVAPAVAVSACPTTMMGRCPRPATPDRGTCSSSRPCSSSSARCVLRLRRRTSRRGRDAGSGDVGRRARRPRARRDHPAGRHGPASPALVGLGPLGTWLGLAPARRRPGTDAGRARPSTSACGSVAVDVIRALDTWDFLAVAGAVVLLLELRRRARRSGRAPTWRCSPWPCRRSTGLVVVAAGAVVRRVRGPRGRPGARARGAGRTPGSPS